ncbi:MAG: hypothetical protein ACK4QW_01915 [Alphaproteobacteria bacterium]
MAALLGIGLAATAPPAAGVTLRTYFLEMTDRDRGVYLTGLMDALRADPLRESDFVGCVAMQGSLRIHDFLTEVARTRPETLMLDVAPWFFYGARTLCGADVPQPPTIVMRDAAGGPPVIEIAPVEMATVPETALAAMLAAAPEAARSTVGAASAGTRSTAERHGPPLWAAALLAAVAAAAATVAGAFLLRRRRIR